MKIRFLLFSMTFGVAQLFGQGQGKEAPQRHIVGQIGAPTPLADSVGAVGGDRRVGAPKGNPTEEPPAEDVAKLKGGPPLSYKAVANWPTLPKGYNFGPTSGVDVDQKTGNVWVFNRGHYPVMEFNKNGIMLQAWDENTIRLKSAHGIRVAPDGNIWGVDVGGNLVFKMNQEGRTLMVIGNQGPGTQDSHDGFNRPTVTAFKPNGNILVADGYINSRVMEFTKDGQFVNMFGKWGIGDGEFNVVHDVVIDKQGRIYVADRSNARVQVFDQDGKFITKWTDIGQPWGLSYVPKEDAIYMSDGHFNRIIKLNMEGQITGVLSSFGKVPGKVDYPHQIAVDQNDGSIYVAEIKNWRVQKFARQ